MVKIIVSGCETGFRKISFNRLLQSHASVHLAEAHKMVNQILDYEEVSIEISPELEDDFREKAKELGAVLK